MHSQGINKKYRLQAKPGFSKVVNIPRVVPKISYKSSHQQSRQIKYVSKIPAKANMVQPVAPLVHVDNFAKRSRNKIIHSKSSNFEKKSTRNFVQARLRNDDSVRKIKGIGQGRILVICANGPSISEVNFDRIKSNPKVDFYCINKPNNQVFPSKFWGFCDQSQYNRHKEIFNTYEGIIINPTSIRARRHNQILIGVNQGSGFSKNIEAGFYIGRSSSYAAMQVAYYMGYSHIYLFGVDMAADNSGRLWSYGENPDVKAEERMRRFEAEAKSYALAGSILQPEERARYTFCSGLLVWPFKEKFNHMDHKMAVDHILSVALSL